MAIIFFIFFMAFSLDLALLRSSLGFNNYTIKYSYFLTSVFLNMSKCPSELFNIKTNTYIAARKHNNVSRIFSEGRNHVFHNKVNTKVRKFLPTFSECLGPDLESFLFPLVHPQPYFTVQFTIFLYHKVRELENTTSQQLNTSRGRPDQTCLFSLSLSLGSSPPAV